MRVYQTNEIKTSHCWAVRVAARLHLPKVCYSKQALSSVEAL